MSDPCRNAKGRPANAASRDTARRPAPEGTPVAHLVEDKVARGIEGGIIGAAYVVAAAGKALEVGARAATPPLRWTTRELSMWAATAARSGSGGGGEAPGASAAQRWGRLARFRLPIEGGGR